MRVVLIVLFVAMADPAWSLTICSQNLERFGKASAGPEKVSELVRGFSELSCDIIALQEILASDKNSALELIALLSSELQQQVDRRFEPLVGQSNDRYLMLGFLVAKDAVDVIESFSLAGEVLPALTDRQPPRSYSRGPLIVRVRTLEQSRQAVLANIHFKSKRSFRPDPAGLQWETLRMEMAEHLRGFLESRYEQALVSGKVPIIVLGDRNSEPASASARILSGLLRLSDFQDGRNCAVLRVGLPACQQLTQAENFFVSLLHMNPHLDEDLGTYSFRGKPGWIDDILVQAAFFSSDFTREYSSGVYRTAPVASDHNLVYARFVW